jgi:hypothetical protein
MAGAKAGSTLEIFFFIDASSCARIFVKMNYKPFFCLKTATIAFA